jgi:RTX calcium-binding nonapeptide repeat (4 copies)
VKGKGAVIRQAHFMAVVVRAFLIGCAFLLMVGCAGTSAETSKKKEQGSSPKATASKEEVRCEGTRTYHIYDIAYTSGARRGVFSGQRTGSEEEMKKADKKAGQKVEDFGVETTNDLPGCPKGGLLLGTDKSDMLNGKHGDDEVRGLGARDWISGGSGDDVLYGGDGNDHLQLDEGEDVGYGGDGNDHFGAEDGQRDKLYCGAGEDDYLADKNDYVDISCEKRHRPTGGGM